VKAYKFKFCQVKAYFDKGYSLTHYFFKLIAIFGLTSQELATTFYMIIAYTIALFVVGFCWYHFGWVVAEIEVGNRYNLFVQEVRKSKVLNSSSSKKK